ncbi:AGC/PDK1 protein kinase [Microbotryum lychnidis-dioicae p1A1 Lamole]|uniref:non-specific serine/threonine protein kinase n=1 Tax=Microbotryum lychnidis-dioicae (strain p1A1 Lamole / MvSl-1064) TaxID=683840 RepID=U5HFV1_USTV1|nr:AGC/PDK1 protein kinase [Microbotryum lychnidis-dioicae p1A1 Lamole]|eukprot:KDE03549.1 AGC/PDK1 protein kinase [Microbotryum lychnidis-dioicae p1A1 Lamole]
MSESRHLPSTPEAGPSRAPTLLNLSTPSASSTSPARSATSTPAPYAPISTHTDGSITHPVYGSITTPLSTASSLSSASSSIVSRQSSIRSTSSVVAVPIRKPIRGPSAAYGASSPPTPMPNHPHFSSDQYSHSSLYSMPMARNSSSGSHHSAQLVGENFDSGDSVVPIPSSGSGDKAEYFDDPHHPFSTVSTPLGFDLTSGLRDLNVSDLRAPSSSAAPPGPSRSSTARGFVEVGTAVTPTRQSSQLGTSPASMMTIKQTSPQSNPLPIPPALQIARPSWNRASSSNLSDQPALRKVDPKDPSSNPSVMVVRKTPQDFVFGQTLGQGSYSTVSLVTDKIAPHHQYALKVLDKEHIKREKKTKYVLIERDTLKALDGHPGIVRLYWTFQDVHSLYYVLELAKNGELLKWIKKFGSFSLPSARFYAAQLLSAIEHMHSRGVIHRDLKPENILLDVNMRIKVTDFGTAKLLSDTTEPEPTPEQGSKPDTLRKRARSFVGTPEYVSPEILSSGKESSRLSDYWGFGCILYQIIAGRPPFQAKTDYLMFQKIIGLEYEFPLGFDEKAKDLVENLLVVDPIQRLGATAEGIQAIKSHPFFTSEPSIDFSTIWTVTPPPIETGLVQPKLGLTPNRGGEGDGMGMQAVDDLLDEFGSDGLDGEDEDGDGDGEGSVSGPDEEEDEDDFTADTSGPDKMTSQSTQLATRTTHSNTKPPHPTTKWGSILQPSETILLTSPILTKRSLIKKKRLLLLTSTDRLLCLKESWDKVTIKHEVWLGKALRGGVDKIGTVGFIKAEREGEKGFLLRTSHTTLKFEDPSGGAARWVHELNQAHTLGLQAM